MKITRYIILAFSAMAVLSCHTKEMVVFNPEDVVSPVFRTAPELLISSGNVDTGAAGYEWEKADFGVASQIIYSVEAQVGDGPVVEVSSGLSGTKAEVSYQVLNERLVKDLGVMPGFPVEVNFYIAARLNDSGKWYSEAVPARVSTVRIDEERKNLYVVGSFCDWVFNTPQHLYNFDEGTHVYEGFVGFGDVASSGFKFTGGTDWTNMSKYNFGLKKGQSAGMEPSSVTLDNGDESEDIRCFHRSYYQFALDTVSRALTVGLSFDEAFVEVDGIPYQMSYASVSQMLYADVTLTEDSEVLFSFDGGGRKLGGAYDALQYDGEALVYPFAGDCRIYLNLNDSDRMRAEFDKDAFGKGEENFVNVFWGISGIGGDWDTDAVTLVMEDGFYTAKGVTLTSGEGFKLRRNGNWDVNRGIASNDPDEDIVLPVSVGEATEIAQGGKNMGVPTTGQYDIYLNSSASRIYVMTAGSEAPDIESEPSEWGVVGSVNNWGENGDDIAMYFVKGCYVAYGVVFDQGAGNSFKIRAGNEWDDTKNFGLEMSGIVAADCWYPVHSSGGSGNLSVADGVYDVWFDLRNSRIYVMTEGTDISSAVEGEVELPLTWYITGNFNSWNPSDAAYLMDVEEDYFVFRDFTAKMGCEMKFAPGAWGGDKGASGKFEADKALDTGGDNVKVPAGTYDIYLSRDFTKYWFMTGGKKPQTLN